MFIHGIGISGYRSFGPEHQYIGPLKKINLLIGQNNSGKSNILAFLKNHYNNVLDSITGRTSPKLNFTYLDSHIGASSGEMQISFGIEIGGDNYKSFLQNHRQHSYGIYHADKVIEKILKSRILTRGENISWFTFKAPLNGAFSLSNKIIDEFKKDPNIIIHEWQCAYKALVGRSASSLDQLIPEIMRRLSDLALSNQTVALIPAIRAIREGGSTEDSDHSGLGLISRLAKLQNPNLQAQSDKEYFSRINLFLRDVTGNSTATLEIPHERNMILVHMDNKTLPLTSLGTGIHEVVILAAAATVLKNQIVCIEEPELHLHPILQRKLIRYINNNTENQYFITTHSAHLLDTPDSAIFHIRHQNGQTTVESAVTNTNKASICADLGYHASDIMQANSIIWVEGPSDRIYINHWIKSVDSNLIEGIHYSIMFYGGRLLSHLTANDDELNEFISLRRLNRHISIVIDSDKETSRSHMNETKKRIRDEFKEGPGFAWITEGREIENYLDTTMLEDALRNTHKNIYKLPTFGKFEKNLRYFKTKKESCDADKVKIAHRITQSPSNLDVYDLKTQIEKLVDFVRKANDFKES